MSAQLDPRERVFEQRAFRTEAPQSADVLWPLPCKACAVLPVVVGYDNWRPIVACNTSGCPNRCHALGTIPEWNKRQS